jgi:hypothetical protein
VSSLVILSVEVDRLSACYAPILQVNPVIDHQTLVDWHRGLTPPYKRRLPVLHRSVGRLTVISDDYDPLSDQALWRSDRSG